MMTEKIKRTLLFYLLIFLLSKGHFLFGCVCVSVWYSSTLSAFRVIIYVCVLCDFCFWRDKQQTVAWVYAAVFWANCSSYYTVGKVEPCTYECVVFFCARFFFFDSPFSFFLRYMFWVYTCVLLLLSFLCVANEKQTKNLNKESLRQISLVFVFSWQPFLLISVMKKKLKC